MKRVLLRIIPLVDILLVPFLYPCAWLMKLIRRIGVSRLKNCRDALIRVGVFPIRNHYYEPQFDYRKPRQPFSKDRALTGIDWNTNEQLNLLSKFQLAEELADINQSKPNSLDFYLNNSSFESGDAEYWYQLIRVTKPRRIFEVGSGNSTLMAIKAIQRNYEDDNNYKCKHVCIEPFEMPWLEKTNVEVVRKRVEEVDISYFSELEENDILFIDSSHIIRPQGDVLFEYLELLPSINKGVVVHVHDIFSPKNYPKEWLEDRVLFWNEQYLLEAFLSFNSDWKIIGALNYLHHNYYNELKSVAPYLLPDSEPGSFYIKRIS